MSYRLLGPGPTIQGNTVETTHTDKDLGSWTLDYQNGGPGGSPIISPASVQTLPADQTAKPSIAYALQFARPLAPDPDLVPPPPTNPENFTQCRRITIYWTDNSSDETGFRIYRRQNGGGANLSNYALVATIAADQTSFQDTPPNVDVPYYYIVTAVNGDIESEVGPDWPLGPVTNVSCTPNLSTSTKSILKVNNQGYVSGQILRKGDTLRFVIIIRNDGTTPAHDVEVKDTLSETLEYLGNATLDTDGPGGSPPAAINCLVSGGGKVVTCDTGLDKPEGGTDWLLEFDAKLQSTSLNTNDFAENTAQIIYDELEDENNDNNQVNITTGVLLFRIEPGIPDIKEIAP